MALDQKMQTLVDNIVEYALADAKPVTKQQTPAVAMCKFLRPYIEVSVRARVKDESDMRAKKWLVSMEWWDKPGAVIVAESNGRYTVGKEIRAYGGDLVVGLNGVADTIAEYAAQVGAPLSDYGREHMLRALSYLRPTLSKQGGRATMRRESVCGKWWLVANIFREDALPEK